jgi:hypothetical protein
MTDANATRIFDRSQRRASRRRELGKGDVVLSDELGCQQTTLVEFPSSLSTSTATGSMFTVTAKDNIEILSFEFESSSSNEEVEVDIFTLEGKNYLDATSNPIAWTRLSQTTAFKSPDKGDGSFMIAPRADMLTSIPLTTGESRSFYITLQTSDDLILMQSTAENRLLTGQEFHSDSMIRTDVGIGILSGGFGDSVVMDRAFQGRIHYRSLQDCQDFAVTSQFMVPLAVHPSTGSDDFRFALKEAFKDIMAEGAKWGRWNELHGLELLRIEPEFLPDAFSLDDCAGIGFEVGCAVYNSTLTFKHFQTVSSEEIEFELVSSIEASNSFVDSVKRGNSPEMVYVGERLLKGFYEITLSGVPPNTTLGSIQQEYISDTTLDFLRSFSSELPYLVEIIDQRALEGRRHLRGVRQLQSQGLVLETYIYGIGEDSEEFFVAIEDAFRQNEELYTAKLQREQYRPGAINEYVNLGFVFSYISRTSVYSNETVAENTTLNWYEEMPLWMMIAAAAVSGVIILGCLIVAYRRCCKPLCCGEKYEKKRVSDKRISPQPQDALVKDNPNSRSMPFRSASARTSTTTRGSHTGPGNREDLRVSTGQNRRFVRRMPYDSVRSNTSFQSRSSNQSNLGTTSSSRRNASLQRAPSSGSNTLKNNSVHSGGFTGQKGGQKKRSKSVDRAKKTVDHSAHSSGSNGKARHMSRSKSLDRATIKNSSRSSSASNGKKGPKKTADHSAHSSGSNGKARHMSRSKSLDRATINNSSRSSSGSNGKKEHKKTPVRTKSKSVDASKRVSNINDSVRSSRSEGVKGSKRSKSVDRPKGDKGSRRSKKKANVKGFLGTPKQRG